MLKEKIQNITMFYIPLAFGVIIAFFIYVLFYKLMMLYSISGFFIFTAGFCLIGLFYNLLAYYHGRKHSDTYRIAKSLNRMYEHGVICIITLLLIPFTFYVSKLFNVFYG